MEFLSYLISGISLGSVYAIIALGYTMVYGDCQVMPWPVSPSTEMAVMAFTSASQMSAALMSLVHPAAWIAS